MQFQKPLVITSPHHEMVKPVFDRPSYHVRPRRGWVNDPNGPIYYKGNYHMFYQHAPDNNEWSWGLVWGHAKSKDLVHWEHMPHALTPTHGGDDADGCWSGCATLDVNGVPTILYTGVRLRENCSCGPPPPPGYDLGNQFFETQLAAVCEEGDESLTSWRKLEEPCIQYPPKDIPLTAWRDPFIIERPHKEGEDWIFMIGCGLDGKGLAAKYRSKSLTSGWIYEGALCKGNGDTGHVWECPVFAKLPSVTGEVVKQSHFFSACPNDCKHTPVYWLGDYKDGRFDMDGAQGPHKLDLGEIFYAPQLLQNDPKGRTIMWGWMQERRVGGDNDYACCLSVPRELRIHNGKLHQRPVEEISALRRYENAWYTSDVLLKDGGMVAIPMSGTFMDFEVSFEMRSSTYVGFVVRHGDRGSMALVYNWATDYMQVLHGEWDQLVAAPEDVHTEDGPDRSPGQSSGKGRGKVHLDEGNNLQLRVLVDYSLIEIYTSTGEVLSTRVYGQGDCVIEFVSLGGDAVISSAAAYEMASAYKESIIEHEADIVVPPIEIPIEIVGFDESVLELETTNNFPDSLCPLSPTVVVSA